MKRILKSEKGSALLITLGVLMLISAVAIMSVKRSSEDVDMSYNLLHEEQAFYIAEAGAKQAIAVLDTQPAWRTGYQQVAFGPGNYTVDIIDSLTIPAIFDTMLVASTGEASACIAAVEVAVVRDVIYPFTYAMFADKGISFDRNACTDSWDSDSGSYAATQMDSLGNVGSNGTITSAKDVTFGGDISVATPGGITLGGGNIVNGDTTSTADSVQLDVVPQSEYDWAKAVSIAQTGISGTGWSYNNGSRALTSGQDGNIVLDEGVYYFSSITLGQNTSITVAPGANVIIYVTGDIFFNQYSSINPGGNPIDMMIYSQGSLNFNQYNQFYGTFYGPYGHIQYDQTTEVYGALVGGSIKLDQGACFHYDRALGKVTRYALKGVTPIAWREVDD